MNYIKNQLSISTLLILLTLLAFTAVRTEAAFGDLDTTFGSGARLYGGYGTPLAAALQPDGKILVLTDTNDLPKLRRFLSNGKVDLTFGSDGVAVFPIPTPEFLSGVAVQQDGKIIVTGGVPGGGPWLATVWRLNSGGSPDYSFGTNGMVILPTGCYASFPHLVKNARGLTPTYDIVVYAGFCTTLTPLVYRLTPSGALRSTFGTGGQIQVSYPLFNLRVHQGGIYRFSGMKIAKYSASTGAPDVTFGDQGVFSEHPALFDGCGNTDDNYRYNDIAFQSSGKLLVTGYRYSSINPNYHIKHLTRHEPDGSFDTGFLSVSCESGTAFTPGSDEDALVEVPSDDKIILANRSRNIVERRMPDGLPDASFTAVSTTPHVMIQPDGKILIVGDVFLGWTHYLTLSRYLP